MTSLLTQLLKRNQLWRRNRLPAPEGKCNQGSYAQQVRVDAIDATDAAIGCRAAASTTDKPKWYVLDRTETSVLPITLDISAMPAPAFRSSRSCRSCSIDHNLPLKLNLPSPHTQLQIGYLTQSEIGFKSALLLK
jgi:hypothetical protein